MKIRCILVLLYLVLSGCSIQRQDQKQVEQSTNLTSSVDVRLKKHRLSSALQNEYDTLYTALKTHSSQIILSSSPSVCDTIFEAVLFDHPELFWISATYSYQSFESNKTILYPKYTYTETQAKQIQARVNDVVQPILENANQLSNEYEKVKYIFDYIIDTTTYVDKVQNNQNMLSSLLDKEAVCAGYAKAMKYLLDQLSIPNEIIMVKVLKDLNQPHVLNLVMINKEYYYVDPTFGDGKIEPSYPAYRYAYFAMNSEEMLNLYEPKHPYETTLAFKESYFYHEDSFLESYDEQTIISILYQNIKHKSTTIAIKCKTKYSYEQLKKTVTSQHIFSLFEQAGYKPVKIQYVPIDESYCIFITYPL